MKLLQHRRCDVQMIVVHLVVLRHPAQQKTGEVCDGEHRLIYKVTETEVWIVKCRFHYD